MLRSVSLLALGLCVTCATTARAQDGNKKRGLAQHLDPTAEAGARTAEAARSGSASATAPRSTTTESATVGSATGPKPATREKRSLAILDAELGSESDEEAHGGPLTRPLLTNPSREALDGWRKLTPAQREQAYLALSEKSRKLLDTTTLDLVEKQMGADMGKSVASFGDFGNSLNLVPRIALERDPKAKLQVVGDSYARVVGAKVPSMDRGRTLKVRAQVRDSENYAAVIAGGGGTCGELSYSLRDTINGAFRDQRQPAGREHTVEAQAIMGTGVFAGFLPVGPWSNHASTLVQVDDEVVACDPAYYLYKHKSFEGFTGSDWYLKPAKDWVTYWRGSSEWGTAMGNFSDDHDRTGDATTTPWMTVKRR